MAYKDALVYRVGGEEFNMLLPNVDILEADRVARRLKNKIETTPIETNKGSINVIASLGVATLNSMIRRQTTSMNGRISCCIVQRGR